MEQVPMTLYRIELLDEKGSLHSELELDCLDEDDAIESAGRIDHPHVMLLYEADRLVARFPGRPVWGRSEGA
jgi:hypothetical protein